MPLDDNKRISAESKADVLSKALNKNLISDEDTAAIFYDLSFLESKIGRLQKLFDKSALHAIALKANPLISIQKKLNGLGVGAEAASIPELHLALKSGFPPERIVYDSPVKTKADLTYAMKAGVIINADSIDELRLIDELIPTIKSSSSFGFRINPQVGSGKIMATSVAADYSKFGMPIKEFRRQIIEAYLKYNWLCGIHLHIGSQGIPLKMLVDGMKIVYELAEKINHELEKAKASHRISLFDIGGGLPAAYKADDIAPTLSEYVAALNAEVPGLLDGRYRIITEFGRHIHANAAWAISRAEYIKKQGEIKTVLTHLGADMFIRKCYNPDDWHHDISVIDKNGHLKSGIDTEYVIAGPLCFAGDIIARNLKLPPVEHGDYILIQDVGAYTFSMWSRYNSRQMPKVIGYYNNGERFEILKDRESLDDVYKFWQ